MPSPIALLRASDIPHAERAVARGELVRVRRGIYAARVQWYGLRPWERYLARVHAVALLHPDAIFSHESAAALWGMPVIGDPVIVHVLVGSSAASRESGGIRAHRAASLPEIVATGGVLVVSPASVAVTMARHRHNALGLAAADAALRLDRTTTRDAMTLDNETRDSSRGRRHARWALDRADAARASILEAISSAAIEWLGFPAPVLQHPFRSANGDEFYGDNWWPEIGLVGEPDGEFTYDGRFGDPVELLRKRHERDRSLLRAGARAVAHWGWIDTARVRPLQRLLVGHGLRQDRPEDSAQLTALIRALAPYDRLLTSTRATRPDRERTTGRRDNG